jgi:HK97 family phage prohead protease
MLERKIIDSKALDIDTTNRKVKVAISRMGAEDRDKDIIERGAYNMTILAKGPKGTNEIWHLTDHGWRIADSALSKYQELGVENDYLYGVAPYRDSWLWREVAWPLYEAGDITQHSVGFQIVRSERNEQTGIRIIKEIELWEGSAVLWGAQPDTPVMDLVKSHFENRKESYEDRVNWIIKAIKKGKYQGEDESLLILELRELEGLNKTLNREGSPTPEKAMDAQKLALGMATVLCKFDHI